MWKELVNATEWNKVKPKITLIQKLTLFVKEKTMKIVCHSRNDLFWPKKTARFD